MLNRRRREERGASAVEFALVMTVLFMVLFGVVQFGMAYNRAQGLEAASREGARAASVGATYDEILARVRAAQSMFRPADVQITTTPATNGTQRPCSIAGVGNSVRVEAFVPQMSAYAIAIPLWGKRQIRYTATGVFRCERGAP
ncbi:MAG TPA: TadE/TadG family type IV pilus assembly protein [Actinomycetota bacterium]|nr:TadE/TadG family type IV pilus assembly protein [Actinomycetota bacterium]